MRFVVTSRALQQLAVLSIGFSMACFDAEGTNSPPPTLNIGVEPRVATVSQGDSSDLVAVVSANFKLVNAPEVHVTGTPPGVVVRVSRITQGINLASVALVISVAPTVVPGTYGLQLYATNAARESPSTGFMLTVAVRPDCSQAAPCVQWARSATASSEYTSGAWSAHQATGAPNATGCSDDANAWASLEPNTVEWLEVVFSEALVPAGIQVHENYGVSSIVSIEVKDEQGVYRTVFTATPGHLVCPSARTIPVTGMSAKVKAVRLTFDQRTLNDWNEVDAVGLVGYRVGASR
jgi:hypothetical protein